MTTALHHRVLGTLCEWLGGTLVKVRQAPAGSFRSKLDDMGFITMNITNAACLPPIKELIGQTVEVTISALPDHSHDSVFGTLTLLSVSKKGQQTTKLSELALSSTLALRKFMLEWSSGAHESGSFSSPTQVTFLLNDTRYTEHTCVTLTIENDIGTVSLPESSVLSKYGLLKLFDTIHHTFSLRSSGSLCIVSQDIDSHDFVFWINAQATKHWMRTLSVLPN